MNRPGRPARRRRRINWPLLREHLNAGGVARIRERGSKEWLMIIRAERRGDKRTRLVEVQHGSAEFSFRFDQLLGHDFKLEPLPVPEQEGG